MAVLSFKPKQIAKKFIVVLNERPRDVLTQRFGICDFCDRRTLEAIGQTYGITRERVRQIENSAISAIKESDAFKTNKDVFLELKDAIDKKGSIAEENELLDYLAGDSSNRNYIYFLLVLGDEFNRIKEDDKFYHRWTTNEEMAKKVQSALERLHEKVRCEDLMQEEKIISYFKDHAKEMPKKEIEDEIVRSWLNISKIVARNQMGEWGCSDSSHIHPRGMSDYAFLVLRKEGSPLRFTEVAKKIGEVFEKKAHPATVHNGLIKDPRFVLVGRGLYALKDWGYSPGAVRDIIEKVLKENGPVVKEDILKNVLKERYVKESTILVNLQNRDYFVKGEDGKYRIA